MSPNPPPATPIQVTHLQVDPPQATRSPPYRPGTPVPPDDELLLGLVAQLRLAAGRFVELIDGVRPWSRDDVWRGDRADRFVEELLGHRARLVALDAVLRDVAAHLESSVGFPLADPPQLRSNLAATRGNLGG